MTIRWTAEAQHALESIFVFLSERNESAAWSLIRGILASVERLTDYPQAGRAGRVLGTRELVLATIPYIAVYRIEQDEIQVLAVLHASRRWPASL